MRWVLLIIVIVALSGFAGAQGVGCCCSAGGAAQNETGGVQPDASFCDAGHPFFAEISAQALFDNPTPCVDECAAFVPGICGDGNLDDGEECDDGNTISGDGCSSDCNIEIEACDLPGFDDPPDIGVSPVQGEKSLRLTWTVPCPASTINVTRCEGDDCTEGLTVAVLPAALGSFDDESVKWDQDYTYTITANYEVSGESQPAVEVGNAGDIECWYKYGGDQFCVTSRTYYEFRDYLQQEGYAGTSRIVFSQNFDTAVDTAFSDTLNKAWACGSLNKLFQGAGFEDCLGNEVCTTFNDGNIGCAVPECEASAGLFGLFSNQTECESSYCFFDRSKTVVDTCYECNSLMTCSDYRSRGACDRNNCGVGVCEWRDTFPDLGIGVCIDKRFDNCPYCSKEGSEGAPNLDAFSEVYDACTETKANALSTLDYPCFFSRDLRDAASCSDVACINYGSSPDQCGDGGVVLDGSNNIVTGSDDTCGLRICEFDPAVGCYKNDDGDGQRDCTQEIGSERAVCERDVVAPVTTVFPMGPAGRHDTLSITVMDKSERNSSLLDVTSDPGVLTHICVDPTLGESNPCTDASTFTSTNSSGLLLQNLEVIDGQTTIAVAGDGENDLYFYSRDASNNVEIVKKVRFSACAACSPPQIVSILLESGRIVDGVAYTNKARPKITVRFVRPAEITYATIEKNDGTVIPFSRSPTMSASEFTLLPQEDLQGAYTITFDAKNSLGISLDSPEVFEFISDATVPAVSITPQTGTVLQSGSVDVKLEFSKKVLLNNVSVVTETGFGLPVVRELTGLLAGTGNRTFEYSFSNIGDGRHTLYVEAEDYAGNPVSDQAVWYRAEGPVGIFLKEPGWGVAPETPFLLSVDTTGYSNCGYVIDLPSPPNAETGFGISPRFTITGAITHEVQLDRIASGDRSEHSLVVFCNSTEGKGYSARAFNLSVDPDPPSIVSAAAVPDPVLEPVRADVSEYETNIVVQLDKEGFCRYHDVHTDYELMSEFPGWDILPKTSLSALVTVTTEGTHTFNVICESKAGVVSGMGKVSFDVNPAVPLTIKSVTSEYWSTTNITIGVESNKRTYCFIGLDPDTQSLWMEPRDPVLAHTYSPVISNDTRNKQYFIKCLSPITGEESSVLPINLTIDVTPPEMLYVNDDTSLHEDPQVWYETDRLWVSYLGEDIDSYVTQYLVMLQSKDDELIFNWTPSTELNGSPVAFTGLNLVDGAEYVFSVRARNRGGLLSDALDSDGVRIDTSMKPEDCENGLIDINETDVDCGGACAPCGVGMKCNVGSDCESSVCNAGVCAEPSCSDGILTAGFETGVDCGGACPSCTDGGTCLNNSDCAGGICSNGVCSYDPCNDGLRTEDTQESDIDCGGACPSRCGEGQNCFTVADCEAGMGCDEFTQSCASSQDSDNDGVTDSVDLCPATPYLENVDVDGCSLSQKYSLGDGIDDKWRLDNFGCVDCAEAAADADPDKDDLTNFEEYRAITSPILADSDHDNWIDGTEVKKGTDPLDPRDHPTGLLMMMLWILLILLIISGVGFGGYLLYEYWREKRVEPEVEFKPAKLPPKVERPGLPAGLRERLKMVAGPKKHKEPIEKLRKISEKPKKKPNAVEKLRELAKKRQVRGFKPKPKKGTMEKLRKISKRKK